MNPMRFDFSDAGWTAENWSGPRPPQLLSIRGQDESNVWASGFNGTIAQRLSGGWQSGEIYGGLPNLRGIAFDSTGACKVAAENGLSGVGPCDGGPLELTLSAIDDHIYNNGLWSPSPGVFYAAGVNSAGNNYEGRIWAREGGNWDAGLTSDTCRAISIGRRSTSSSRWPRPERRADALSTCATSRCSSCSTPRACGCQSFKG